MIQSLFSYPIFWLVVMAVIAAVMLAGVAGMWVLAWTVAKLADLLERMWKEGRLWH